THDELLEALWPKTYVPAEALKSHIAAIRAVLGDDAKPIFIETRSRRGYRFIAPVTEDAPARSSRTTNLPEAVSELIGRFETADLMAAKALLASVR
ncbi:MAG TPA: winged helix-turn-helix domain-containing protein, partial [Candidatus Dormibacteraeota bacterium]|nr:winged helix-turn-helix domain-containing protein [Candidatus Dormibacteraeota bacterium]